MTKCLSKMSLTMVVAAAMFGLRADIVVSDGPVVPGEWNSNFSATLEAANSEHRPMLLVHVSRECPVCVRLNKMLDGEAFHRWQKDRKLFMAYRVTSGSGNEARTETRNFITSVAGENPGFPYVCAYWHKDDGTTNCVAFAGRRGDMCKDEKFSLFSVEFMTAIDRVIGEYLAKDPSHSTIDQIVSNSLKTISFEKVGAKGGSVAINPPTGLLPEGGKVTLHAKPDKEAMFVGWRYPDGSHAGWNMKLDVSGSMPAGKYKAVFRNPAECPPPELTNVTTSFFAQVKQKFVCTVPVSDSCRPVSFRAAKSLPKGLKLDKITGRISGAPRVRGTSTFTIYVTGADPAHTVKSFTVSLMVQ